VALEHVEGLWLTEDYQLSLAQLAELAGLSEVELRELVDYGAIAPVDPRAAQWVFTATCLTTVRAANRLRASFELEPHGVALVLSLLDRIRDLEAQLHALRAQTPDRSR
jgi:chaperone modulatory protein CbpM